MTRTSWLKKLWKGRSKGVSTVIGTVFLILIIFMVSTNVLLWTFSQNALYTQAAKDENQRSADKLNENVIASNGNYSVSVDEVTVNVMLRNAGSVAVQIINLWVFDTNSSNRRYANKSLDFSLNPGDTLNLLGSGETVIIPGADPSHDFVSWFVTARGNTIPLEAEQAVIVAQLAQGIGSMALDFYTFRYFGYESDSKLANYTDGIKSFSVPWDTPIAFGVSLTNLDPAKETIYFDKYSQVWLDFPDVPPGQGGRYVFFLVNVASDGTLITTYTQIDIPYMETRLLVFASKTAAGFGDAVSIEHKDCKNQLCALNLLLHGTMEERDYGQNIPFVSLYCYQT